MQPAPHIKKQAFAVTKVWKFVYQDETVPVVIQVSEQVEHVFSPSKILSRAFNFVCSASERISLVLVVTKTAVEPRLGND